MSESVWQTPFELERVIVDGDVKAHPNTRKILKRIEASFPEAPIIETQTKADIEEQNRLIRRHRDSFGAGKKVFWLTRGKGVNVHACPGTQKAYCCNYFVIDLVENCPFDCTYCYLQTHLNSPFVRINVNTEDFLEAIDGVVDKYPEKHFRIGTGELADSLAVDALTHQGRDLIQHFASKANATLELKTKSNVVDHLLDIDSHSKTVIAWSVNPKTIGLNDEKGTASIEERITAAKKVAACGYKVAFHFDPIIRYEGWRQGYFDLLTELKEIFSAEHLAWVSLGTLRFPKGLRQVARERFPKSTLPVSEMIMGVDNKERYDAIKRADAYETMIRWLRDFFPETATYLCMENPQVWQNIFQGRPRNDPKLRNLFG